MAEARNTSPERFTLKMRRYDPESGEAPYWDEHTVELAPHRSVLEAILQARDRFDGSIGIRCSCRQAICGSCGVRINGQPALACHTHLDAALKGAEDGVIEIEPMGNMPVIKDLIVDMDAVHWKKIQRVTPWLLAKQPVPEREYLVSHDSMVDVTQTMACIQCGACVSDCLAMEVDPGFIGPAALAKAYRFVGDPRDDQQGERLTDLAQDPQGIFDCTHCFKCVDACPKDVNPMGQIMRLRRIATGDYHIVDKNNGERHEAAFTTLIKNQGLLHEAELLPRSYGGNSWFGKFAPPAGKELLGSLPVVIRGLLRGKINPKIAIFGHKLAPRDLKGVRAIYDKVEGREERYELNLYITGHDEDEQPPPVPAMTPAAEMSTAADASPPAETSPGGSSNG
jgi:succinate dehydrogenase / fumarate reductase iron-sulfur subunit